MRSKASILSAEPVTSIVIVRRATSTIFARKISANWMISARFSTAEETLNSAISRATVSSGSMSRIFRTLTSLCSCLVTWSIGWTAPSRVRVIRETLGSSVGPTDDPTVSRITLTLDGAVHPIDQVIKQLHKLVNVLKIRDMEPEETVAREMALFKVSAAVENRAEIIQFADIFRAKIVDVARRTMTIEVTGSADKIEAFERMIRPHGLIEMVRTGEIAIARAKPES